MAVITRNGLNTLALIVSVVGIICLFNFTSAQTTLTPTSESTTSTSISTPAPQPSVSCQEAIAKNVNLTLFHGEWFEAARKIQNSSNTESCNSWNFLNETNPVTLVSTYNTDSNKLWANQSTPGVQINVTDGVYTLNNTDGTFNIFKILDTDYDTFAFICSYKNSTENTSENESASTVSTTSTTTTSTTTPSSTTSSSSDSTSTTTPAPSRNSTADAYIFVRHRTTNSTFLSNLTALAESKYLDFDNLTMVTQTSKCTGGASAMVPMLSLIMTIVLATIYKF